MQIKVYTINVKLPGWLRRTLVMGVVPAVILGICAIVYATAVTGQPDFAAGEPLSASSLNAHLGALQSQIDTANGKLATAVVPDANGSVGIGTTSPGALLHVFRSAGSVPMLNIDGNQSGNFLVFTNQTSSNKQWHFSPSGGDLVLSETNVANRVTFQSGGNVGIGTTTPASKLHTYGNDPEIRAESNSPLGDSNVSLKNLSQQWNWHLHGTDGAFRAFNVTAMSYPFTITNTGKVGITTGTPQYALDVTGTIRGDNVTPSDRSLKKNIAPLPADTLSRICKISGVSFEWDRQKLKESLARESSSQASTKVPDVDGFSKTPQIGLIAQDVERVFPSLVETDGTGIKSIHYMGVTAVLLEAVKAQQKQIEELTARVRALEEPRSGARAAHARPAQRLSRSRTVGIDRLPTQASGA